MNTDQIKELRKKKFKGRDSRKQLSKVSGVTVKSIINYETGSRRIPKWYPILLKLIKSQGQ